jgi:hypothetical protein
MDPDAEPRFWRATPRSSGTGTLGSNLFCLYHPMGVRNYRRVENKFMNNREIDFDRPFRGFAGISSSRKAR